MPYNLSRYEMETHITWNAEEKIASIWTCDPVSIRKLDKLVSQFPETYKCVERGGDFAKYQVAAKFVRFGKPVSEARREANMRNIEKIAQTRASESQEGEEGK